MLIALQVFTIMLAAVVLASSLAHALELPGKLRLAREQYLAVQTIYYPGFTIAGLAEPLSVLVSFVLLFFTPAGMPFWLALGGVLALLLTHLVYWLWTHPVNNFWLKGFQLKGVGARFFGSDPLRRENASDQSDWTILRDRWEYSQVVPQCSPRSACCWWRPQSRCSNVTPPRRAPAGPARAIR
jgi:hypothetical protein